MSRLIPNLFTILKNTERSYQLGVSKMFIKVINNPLEFHGTRGSAEGVKRSRRVLEIQGFGVVVVRGVHRLELGVMLEHVHLGFTTVIANECSGNTKPLIASLVHGANFDLAVFLDLLGAVLGLAGLNVELALENVGGSERTNARLITVNRCQKICTAFLEKLYDFFHFESPVI